MPATPRQQRFMRMVKARQRGHDVGGPRVEAAAKRMNAEDVQDFISNLTRAPITPERSKAGIRRKLRK